MTNKPATQFQLLGVAIPIILFSITTLIMVVSRVTALETHQETQKEINVSVDKKLDKIIDLLITKK